MWWFVALHPLPPLNKPIPACLGLVLIHGPCPMTVIPPCKQILWSCFWADGWWKYMCHKKRFWLAGCYLPSANFKCIHLSSIDICWFSGAHGCEFFSKYFGFIIQLQKVAGEKWLDSANNILNLYSSHSARLRVVSFCSWNPPLTAPLSIACSSNF